MHVVSINDPRDQSSALLGPFETFEDGTAFLEEWCEANGLPRNPDSGWAHENGWGLGVLPVGEPVLPGQ